MDGVGETSPSTSYICDERDEIKMEMLPIGGISLFKVNISFERRD
jgi:hypothetical protein